MKFSIIIATYSDLVDHNFITTDSSVVKKNNVRIKNLNFFFVPLDKNIECFDVFKLSPVKDIFTQ